MPREPVVSGLFYESDKEKLLSQIEQAFNSGLGPGPLDKNSGSARSGKTRSGSSKKVIGAISPHAGLFFSGACAAHTYKAVADTQGKNPRFIIIAPNHTGFGLTSLTTEDYETPLGTVRTDKQLAEKIMKNAPGLIDDMGSHFNEHSLEVQLPFLQYIYGNDFYIVPIVISSANQCHVLSESLSKLGQEDEFIIIASSDFTHYGPNYDYEVFKDNVRENVKKLDLGAIEKIKSLDYRKFLDYIHETRATICGYLPISVLMSSLKDRTKEISMLKYYQSSDIMPDKNNSVSYASVVFYSD